jgi:hypothetical protein
MMKKKEYKDLNSEYRWLTEQELLIQSLPEDALLRIHQTSLLCPRCTKHYLLRFGIPEYYFCGYCSYRKETPNQIDKIALAEITKRIRNDEWQISKHKSKKLSVSNRVNKVENVIKQISKDIRLLQNDIHDLEMGGY